MKTIGDIFKVMGEVDLNEIKNEAQQPFSLFLTGETTLVEQFASHLSDVPGKRGFHPWLVIEPLPIKLENLRWAAPEIALLMISEAELTPTQKDALAHFYDAKIPTIVIVVNEIAERLIGAELPRKRESLRVVLSTLDAESIEQRLSPAILKVLPDQHKLSLARQFPLLRDVIIYELIEKTSYANGAVAASTGITEAVPGLNLPLNVADIVLLTKNQLILAYKVALAHGKEGDPIAVIGEIVGVLGQAFFFREIARQLVGLVPVIGLIPKIAISYSGTWVIGQTTHLWAKNGEILEPAQMTQLYEDARERGKTLAQSLLPIPLGKRDENAADSSVADEDLLPDATPQIAINWQEFFNWLLSYRPNVKSDKIGLSEEVGGEEESEGSEGGFLWGRRLLMGKKEKLGSEGSEESEGSQGSQGGEEKKREGAFLWGRRLLMGKKEKQGSEESEGSEGSEGGEGTEGIEEKKREGGFLWGRLLMGKKEKQGSEASQTSEGNEGSEASEASEASQTSEGSEGNEGSQTSEGSEETKRKFWNLLSFLPFISLLSL